MNMAPLLQLWDLITSDALTLAATSVLAVAVLALLVLICWPARDAAPQATSQRSAQARALVASGVSAMEVARRTGLSRDALALMIGSAGTATRKKGPDAARLAFFRRQPTISPSLGRSHQATA
jgi:hypothetical protein